MVGTRLALALSFAVALAVAGCGDDDAPSDDASRPRSDASVEDTAVQLDDAGTDAGSARTDSGPPPPPSVELGRHDVAVVSTVQIIPGDGLPPEAPAMTSNNNLDVVRHSDGRIYLAWRTGPDHFASDETRIHVVSSIDEETWEYEASFFLESDLREPRFLSLGDRVFLYLARLGTNPLAFEPQGMSFSERSPDGTWSPLTETYRPGFIPWRTRIERGTPFMVAYLGGEHIYTFDGIPLEIELLTTSDGREWVAYDADRPVVSRGGGSETDFVLADDGSLFGVIRNEAGDETGWGSKICRAPATDITDWTCVSDPRKYDSPLMFWYDGEAYLIARRNVTETGNYDLMQRRLNMAAQTARYQLDYIGQPKRCALWRYVQDEDRIAFVLDLPSRGDTCFPSIVSTDEPGRFVVYNYSSPIDGPELTWNEGQRGPTNIYRHELVLTPR
ncbi:MAG: hypothetical protein IT379_08745 [Deltaproteobacteria bacterium]|nr:hypothetical protein [Deltaproteobacteria bacterium]